jgi:hypothetical protein
MIRLAFVLVLLAALAYQAALAASADTKRYPPGWDTPCVDYYRALIWTAPGYGAGWLASKVAAHCQLT